MTAAEYSKIAIKIPINPGIYQYYNEAGQLIYVGKAKHLRKRISSYFTKQLSNQKTIELVQRIHQIEFTIVNSEEDAFLLENTLIKKYQPFYNINLKDDKTYPYLVIKNEPFPRVFFSRRKLNDQAEYFGPYATVGKVWDMLEFIKQHIPLRNCKLNLSEKNIQQNKFKVCLEYHLGNCKGPCEGFQSLADYEDGIEQLRSLLKGNLFPLLQHFKKLIQLHSEALEFEKAAYYQQKIAALLQYQAKSIVVNTKTGTVDVFTMIEEGDRAFVNYLAVSNGSIILTKTIRYY